MITVKDEGGQFIGSYENAAQCENDFLSSLISTALLEGEASDTDSQGSRVSAVADDDYRAALESWWSWHDQDQMRWSQSTEEAAERASRWAQGLSDDGPDQD